MHTWIKVIAFLTITTVSQACASNSPRSIQTSEINSSVSEPVLYAKLEKTEYGYRFTQLSESYDHSAPWIRLNDGHPMWQTDQESCTTGIVDMVDHHFQCQTVSAALFRTKSISLSLVSLSSYTIASVLTYGLFAAFPPATVTFDEAAYQAALHEAKNAFENKLVSLDVSSDKLLVDYAH